MGTPGGLGNDRGGPQGGVRWDVASCVQLHEAGIVSGDARLENVLVDGNDDAWIVDFGGVSSRL